MKIGIIFEYGDDISKYVPYQYIVETLLKIFEPRTEQAWEIWCEVDYYIDITYDDFEPYDPEDPHCVEEFQEALHEAQLTPYERLTITQQVALAKYGYDAEKFNSFDKLFQLMRPWALTTGFNYKHVFNTEELDEIEHLVNVCNIINFHD